MPVIIFRVLGAGVAAMVLTAEAVVADFPEPAGAGGMPDMGGIAGMM